jgi:hypothetical protein
MLPAAVTRLGSVTVVKVEVNNISGESRFFIVNFDAV